MSVQDEKMDAIPRIDAELIDYAGSDDAQLEMLGYKQEFKRDFSFIGLWSLVSSELAVLPGVAGTIWCAPTQFYFPSLWLIARRYTMGYWCVRCPSLGDSR